VANKDCAFTLDAIKNKENTAAIRKNLNMKDSPRDNGNGRAVPTYT